MVIATASDEGHPLERYRRTWELHGSWSYPFISQKLETHQNLEVFEEKTNQQNATTRRRPVPWSEYPHQFCCSSSINMKQKKHWYYPIPCLYYPPKPWFFVGHFAHILGHLGTVCWRTGNGIWEWDLASHLVKHPSHRFACEIQRAGRSGTTRHLEIWDILFGFFPFP